MKPSKFPKKKFNYGDVYLDKDLTLNEIEEERALKRLRKKRNYKLQHSDWRYKQGKTENGIEFFGESDSVNCIELTEPPEEQFKTTSEQWN